MSARHENSIMTSLKPLHKKQACYSETLKLKIFPRSCATVRVLCRLHCHFLNFFHLSHFFVFPFFFNFFVFLFVFYIFLNSYFLFFVFLIYFFSFLHVFSLFF